ncbi:MAG: hypothetical protein R3A12_11575 [Ignavibacteria bacterium]
MSLDLKRVQLLSESKRKGESIVNPKSDFELAEKDVILLLGNDEQISAAKVFLNFNNVSG